MATTKKETAEKKTTAKKTTTKKADNETTTAKKTTTKKAADVSAKVEKTETKTTTKKAAVKETATTTEKPTTRTFYKSYNKNFGGKRRKKFCKFCAKGIEHVDYKDVDTLKKYLNQHLKIMAARVTGTCGRHQRRVSNAIKRARIVALIPFIVQD